MASSIVQPDCEVALNSKNSRDLPTPRLCLLGRMPQRLHLALASDELGQPAPDRALQSCSQRPDTCHLIDIDRLAHTLDSRRPQRLEREIALDQLAQPLADRD